MEYVPSIKANNNEALDKAGVTLEDREFLAECLAHAYLRQFCAHKFFSTDPHAGNLGIEVFEDERAPRVVFYDFGQACSLADDQAGGILEIIESIVDSDAKKSVSAFSRMGVLKDSADLEMVQAKCQQNYDEGKLKVKKRKSRKSSRYTYNTKEQVFDKESEKAELDARIDSAGQAKNTTDTSEGVNDLEVMASFTLQSEYAFVARALSQMDGVGKSLDPEFDFISAAAPYLVEVKGTGKYLTDEIKKKFTFVYGEDGILAKELQLFKSLGLKLPTKE
jgi:predicted unusual protein kinase regulating ubiquinone biosynthesis (AarF/ABC1/UbiB family)